MNRHPNVASHTVEDPTVVKRKGARAPAARTMSLDEMMPRERSHTRKATY